MLTTEQKQNALKKLQEPHTPRSIPEGILENIFPPIRNLGCANSWGWNDELDKPNRPEIVENCSHKCTCETLGRCYHRYTCEVCGYTYTVDSGD
jgi:hypothetical protein